MHERLKSSSECTGCMACVNACNRNCISMIKQSDGFFYPIIDENNCVSCGACTNVCRAKTATGNKPMMAVACYNHDSEIRYASSSGGAFMILAEDVIKKGGAVYGAAFDQDFSVVHIRADSTEEARKLMGSKYVQSRINDIYRLVARDLASNRYVLFSGTPCQIYALNSFLGRNHDRLITVEVICHGVPSPGVWHKYFEGVKRTLGNDIKSINFRDKSTGWKRYSVGIYTAINKLIEPSDVNIYMRLFLGDYILRESCYHCRFTSLKRYADITIGDCWGIDKICPDMQAENGVSVIILNTQKSLTLFRDVSEGLDYMEVSVKDVIRVNKSYLVSPLKPSLRKEISQFITRDPDTWYPYMRISDRMISLAKRIYSKLKIEIIMNANRY